MTIKQISAFLLCIILAATFTVGCKGNDLNTTNVAPDKIEPQLIDGNTEFAFNIFKQLNMEDADKGVFICPLSISTALTMTYNGASSTTAEAMAEALRYQGIDMGTLNESYKNLLAYLGNSKGIDLNISNSIWINKGTEVKEDFLLLNKEIFNAYIDTLDFSDDDAVVEINNWISKSTKGKIKKMLNPPIPPMVVMYLINAIYFKGEWAEQFDKNLTFTGEFHTMNGETISVQMMNKKGKTEYGSRDGFKAARLPYKDKKKAMYFILPDEGININDFIKDLNAAKWEEIKSVVKETDDVILQIPRFKMEYGIKNLNKSLIALGMGEAFTPSADFSGIREEIYISRVLHKAVVEVNEEGSEAAGVTVVEMLESAAMEPIAFIADRPFIFAITDDETDTIMFIGKLDSIID